MNRSISGGARPSTFSIVAHDRDSQEWGIAVASRFLAVGAVVPWARAGAGAIATQSYANTSFGPAGLELLAQGLDAQTTLDRLLAADPEREQRQVGIVGSGGDVATFTGSECYEWAGGRTGEHFAAQGNILAGPDVVESMAQSFERSSGPLVDRLLLALAAGQAAGGDRRGQQSAAVLVVRPAGGYAGFNDRFVDLRVDDHATPIDELQRLTDMHRLLFFDTRPEDILPVDQERAGLLQRMLRHAGHQVNDSGVYDTATQDALRALFGAENLEGRWRDGPEIDRVALDYLVTRYPV